MSSVEIELILTFPVSKSEGMLLKSSSGRVSKYNRDHARLIIWRLGPLIRHLEKQQIRKLFHIITVAHPVIAEDVTVVPEFLNDCG